MQSKPSLRALSNLLRLGQLFNTTRRARKRPKTKVAGWAIQSEELESRILLSADCDCGCDEAVYVRPAARIATAFALVSSPFAPPEIDNSVFVVDEGPYLDTGCTFNTDVPDGKLVVEVPIDRYFGDVTALRAAGLLPDFVKLQMPAFDIDIDLLSGGLFDERDAVFFNGHRVNEEFLTGTDNEWKLNTFQIPIEWINFPADPGEGGELVPAVNTLEVQIDTLNQGWCTSLDWVALTVPAPNPVFLVHGELVSNSAWQAVWIPGLTALGVPVADVNLGGTFTTPMGTIEENAAAIDERIFDLQTRWGFSNITIVAQGKGGIDARQFIEDLLYDFDPDNDDMVSALFQIGTPNAGTPFVDVAAAGTLSFASDFGFPSELITIFGAEAGSELSPENMRNYNENHSYNEYTEYFSLAGAYTPGGTPPDTVGEFVDNLLPGIDDSLVQMDSVFALDYATHLSYASTGPNGQAAHNSRPGVSPGQMASQDIYDMLLPLVLESGDSSFGTTSSAVAGPLFAPQPQSLPPSDPEVMPGTGTISGMVAQGADQIHQLVVDGGQPAYVTLFYLEGELDVTLTAPNGDVITPAVAANDPEIEYSESTLGLKTVIYELASPQGGTWTVKVHGTSVPSLLGVEPYLINAWFPTSTLHLTASVDQAGYSTGDTIVISATLADGGAGVTGATVTAEVFNPSFGSTNLSLFDDGTHGDAIAGDGVYTNGFDGTSTPGLYNVLVNATGNSPSSFSRQDLILAAVAEVTGSLSGFFSDETTDPNFNGLADELVIHAGVNIANSGFFRFVGEIRDSQNNVIDEASFAGNLTPADSQIDLVFNGNRIFENGVDGPYTLSVIRMGQDSGGISVPVQKIEQGYQTAAYGHATFEHPSIVATGLTLDQAVDNDFNSLFDALNLSLGVNLATEAFYQWTGRLVDSNGREIGFAAGSDQLTAGANSITFSFLGSDIGGNGVNGPYFLTDILINSAFDSAVILDSFATQGYQADQFEGFSGQFPSTPSNLDLAATSDTGRFNDDNFTGDTTPTLTVQADAGVQVQFLVNQTPVNATETSPGVYSATLASGIVVLGANTVQATATNAQGTSPASPTLVIQLAEVRNSTVATGQSLTFLAPNGASVGTQVMGKAGSPVVANLTLLANNQFAEITTITYVTGGTKKAPKDKLSTLAITASGGQGFVGVINIGTALLQNLNLSNVSVGQINAQGALGAVRLTGTSAITASMNVALNVLSVLAEQSVLGGVINVGGNLGLVKLAGAFAGSGINVAKTLSTLDFGGNSNIAVRAKKIKLITSKGVMNGSYTATSITSLTSTGAFLANLGSTKVSKLNVPPG